MAVNIGAPTAQSRIAENLLVIEDRALAALYHENWRKRRVSVRYTEALPPDTRRVIE